MSYAVDAMPRPRSLTDARIASAALAVVDRDGLAALSMRAVAAELGMATMALYRYVESREQLETLLVDLLLDTVETRLPPDLPWDRQVTTLLGRIREALLRHPRAVPLVLARWSASAGARRCTEAVLKALAAAGFTGRRRATAQRALIGHLLGAIQLAHAGPSTRTDPADPADSPSGAGDRAGRGDCFPDVPPEEVFHDGLAALLRGLAAGPAGGPTPPGLV